MFESIGVRLRGIDKHRRAVDDLNMVKLADVVKLIPTPGAGTSFAGPASDRNDRHSGGLGEIDATGLGPKGWSGRAVSCKRDGVSALQRLDQNGQRFAAAFPR